MCGCKCKGKGNCKKFRFPMEEEGTQRTLNNQEVKQKIDWEAN